MSYRRARPEAGPALREVSELRQEQPDVSPQESHFRQVPLRASMN